MQYYDEYVGKIPGHQCIVDMLGDAANGEIGLRFKGDSVLPVTVEEFDIIND
jgi:hypothetical protein